MSIVPQFLAPHFPYCTFLSILLLFVHCAWAAQRGEEFCDYPLIVQHCLFLGTPAHFRPLPQGNGHPQGGFDLPQYRCKYRHCTFWAPLLIFGHGRRGMSSPEGAYVTSSLHGYTPLSTPPGCAESSSSVCI